MQHVGVRELKNGLSRFLSLVTRGERIVVTERGTPIAVIHSPDRVEDGVTIEEKLLALSLNGALALPEKGKKRETRTRPVPIRGKPVSRMVLEDRR